jgi:hypothetical protein
MRDVLMLLLIAAFFAACIAYVAWCDRIIGPDPAEASTSTGENDAAGRIVDEVPVS